MRKPLAAIVFTIAAGAAFANNCPNEMKAVDAALPGAKLSPRR